MGTCVSYNISSKEELFIQKVFFDMKFTVYNIQEFTQIINQEKISHLQYETFLCPKLYNPHPTYKYISFHDNFFELIYREIQPESIYDLAFYIYPLLKKSFNDYETVIQDFYWFFCKIHKMKVKQIGDFYKIMEMYMYINIMLPAEVVYQNYSKEKQELYIENLYREIFTQNNFKLYVFLDKIAISLNDIFCFSMSFSIFLNILLNMVFLSS